MDFDGSDESIPMDTRNGGHGRYADGNNTVYILDQRTRAGLEEVDKAKFS